MANPQIEDGYTKIANELLVALTKANLLGSDFMICLAVIGKTYGWNKKEDKISITQFQQLTTLSRSTVIRSIDRLVSYVILGSVKGDIRTSSTYWIIKDYDKWKVPSVTGEPRFIRDTRPSVTGEQNLVSQVTPTKYNKRQLKTLGFNFDVIWIRYPKKLGKHDSLRHFNKTVLTQDDFDNINKALDNFLQSSVCKGDHKFIPHGSTWFNNRWKDWINYKENVLIIKDKWNDLNPKP